MNRLQRLIGSLIVASSLLSGNALAHKVLASAYGDGRLIEGEIGFSNGDMAKAGTIVQVSVDGTRVGEAVIDDEGFFSWQAQVAADHHFFADLSAGHIADFMLPADELSGLPGSTGATTDTTTAAETARAGAESGLVTAGLSEEIRQTVARQIKPLRKEISALKEKRQFQDILGGIGYIFGLFGVGAWVAARQKEKQLNSLSQNRT